LKGQFTNSSMLTEKIKSVIRDIPDFPKPGIVFKDITPILTDPQLVREIIEGFSDELKDISIDGIACIESRGFWFGTILAHHLMLPIIPIRKKGKLPYKTVSVSYELEYGSETLEAHEDSIIEGHNILIHDDVLATGGTAEATARLIQESGGKVAGFSFLVDLTFLKGREKLVGTSDKIVSLVEY